MTEQDTTNDDREMLKRKFKLDPMKLTREELDGLMIVAQTENLIARTQLMKVKARWRPLLVLTALLWLVAFVAWVGPWSA